MAKKKAAKAKETDGAIDVAVVGDSEDAKRAPRLGVATVAKPCLIGAALLTFIGAALPH